MELITTDIGEIVFGILFFIALVTSTFLLGPIRMT